MTDTTTGPGAPAAAQPTGSLNVLAQYVKDLSFENPNTAKFLSQPPAGQPNINFQINVNSRQVTPTDYEVELSIEAKAVADQANLFIAELVYAGLFRIAGISQERLAPVLLIDCPHLLFPFARQIIAEATQNGGFAPLLMPPIDFVGLYNQRMQQGGQVAGNA
jgi:preprotein translocase subunit SecB